MARRKKAKTADRRTPRQETVPVSSRAQESLTTLLGQLATAAEDSHSDQGWHHDDEKRLLQKVKQLHSGLQQLGFDESVIRVILVNGLSESVNEGWNLESALDWACLHLSAKDLPSFLTDNVQAVNINTMLDNEDSQRLAVIVPVKNQKSHETIVIEPNVLEQVAQGASSEIRQTEENDEQEAAVRKAWLLAQYEYEDSDNNSDESLQEQVEEEVEESAVLSPDEILLGESQEELSELDSILNDEAQKYMMSKHEIKEMQKKARHLRRVVEGFRRKVQNSKAAVKEDTRNPTFVSEDAERDDDDAGIFSIFEQDDPQENVKFVVVGESDQGGVFLSMLEESEEASSVTPNTPAAPDYSIPSKWTGKTPKKILEEWCQKKKVHRPKFHRRLLDGAQIIVNTKPPISIEEVGPFADFTDAQHYLATRALYELNPDLPMYRLLPPVFRDLWLSWLAGVKQEKEAEKQQSVDAKERKMKELVDAILSQRTVGVVAKTEESFKVTPEVVVTREVRDMWEDKVSEPELQREEISAQGIKLQSSFREKQVTSQYQSMLEARKSLPMFTYRQQLLGTIQENQVTILCAETGAGKTTQCGQFLLEEALGGGFGDKISILCTQPRRVSAISVAERVSEEFCDASVGETVGYHIRLESRRSARTKLLFCTTGVVLRRLQDDPLLEGVTHVLVDEVHERQWQIDFLLIALRQLIHTARKDLKIVLMSATLDAKLFTQFFPGAPLLSVSGRTFPVTNYYLEDLLDATNHVVEEGSRCAFRNRRDGESGSLWVTTKGGEKRKETYSVEDDAYLAQVSEDYVGYKMPTRRSMDRVNEQVINYDLIEDVLGLLLVNPGANNSLTPPDSSVDINAGAVLVFLPGAGEIQTQRERLEGSRIFGDRRRFDIIPMHSTLSPKDQRRAFVKSTKGCQKIILATNIAETSVTIPDVVCVIDSGLVREVHQNKLTSTSTLVTTWCSRASIKQRSGRAGRVQAGICCRLFSSLTNEKRMKDQAIPELQRVPLEEVCLNILASRLGDNCMEFLQQAPQPPSEQSVSLALDLLKEVGAIDSAGQLTSLGHHLSKLPMDVRLGKMLILASMFRCLDPVLTVTASLSCKSPFPAYARDSLEAQTRHRAFKHGTSDFWTTINVWSAYQSACSAGKARKFCDENYLSRSALLEIGEQKEQYLSLLCQIGFVSDAWTKKKRRTVQAIPPFYDENCKKECVVHAVVCAGLYPNVARVHDWKPNELPNLIHNKERVHIHKSSVNSAKMACLPSEWVVFYEKFATHRVYISDTTFVHPFSLLLFGGPLSVKHREKRVMVGEWIEIPVAAQTGVLFRELRTKMDHLLTEMMEQPHAKECKDLTSGIVKLIESS